LNPVETFQTIELQPLWIRRKGDIFYLYSLGGDRVIQTDGIGAEIVRLLKRNHHLAWVLAELEGKYRKKVDIGSFLETLQLGKLMHRVNGELAEPAPSLWRALRHRTSLRWRYLQAYVRHSRVALSPNRLMALLGRLPMAQALFFLRMQRRIFYWRRKGRYLPGIAANMSALLPDRNKGQIERLARKSLKRQMVWDGAEKLLFQWAPISRILAWVPTASEASGVTALVQAVAAGKGALISFFHYGPVHMIPMVLRCLPHDFKITVFGQYRGRPAGEGARVMFVNDFTAKGILEILRRLAAGHLVLMAPDAHLAFQGQQTNAAPNEYGRKAWRRSSRPSTHAIASAAA